MKFVTSYSHYERDKNSYSLSGDRYEDKKVLAFDKEQGHEYLKVVGQFDRYEMIQSHKDSCDLATILSNLDPMQLNNYASTFTYEDLMESGLIDVSSLPKTHGEMLNLVKEGNRLFDGLPNYIREAFNFSSEKFISSFGTDEFNNILQSVESKHFKSVGTIEEPTIVKDGE